MVTFTDDGYSSHLWVLCNPVAQVDPSDLEVLVIQHGQGNHSLQRVLEGQVGPGGRAGQQYLTQAD